MNTMYITSEPGVNINFSRTVVDHIPQVSFIGPGMFAKYHTEFNVTVEYSEKNGAQVIKYIESSNRNFTIRVNDDGTINVINYNGYLKGDFSTKKYRPLADEELPPY